MHKLPPWYKCNNCCIEVKISSGGKRESGGNTRELEIKNGWQKNVYVYVCSLVVFAFYSKGRAVGSSFNAFTFPLL